ncbi:MAG: immunity protein YezG family protein [Clostridia bacterium]
MLNHTKKIKQIYENIQKELFYMIPEKWDKLYLYSSIIDMPDGKKTGELYFYYIPKGILKKKPVNVYEIPNKFNLDENEYLALVKYLYEGIKQVREEFRKSEITGELWSNITITIQNLKFKVEYNYEDLLNSYFNNYERHIIWRYEYLGIGQEQVNKKDREILERYFKGAKEPVKKDIYEAGIYIKDVGNQIGYNTEEIEKPKEPQEPKKRRKNQILLSEEEIKKMKNQGRD